MYAKHKVCHSQRFNKKNLETLEAHLNYQPGWRRKGDEISSQKVFSYFGDEFFSKKWKIIKHISFVFLLERKSLQLLLSTCLLLLVFVVSKFSFSLYLRLLNTHAGSEKTFSTIFVTFKFGLRRVAMLKTVQLLSKGIFK